MFTFWILGAGLRSGACLRGRGGGGVLRLQRFRLQVFNEEGFGV